MRALKTVDLAAVLIVASASSASARVCVRCWDGDRHTWAMCCGDNTFAINDIVTETCPENTQLAGHFANGTALCTVDGTLPIEGVSA